MSLINDKVREIEDIIDSINFKNIYQYFIKRKVAVYHDGFLYSKDETIKFEHNLRKSIKNYNKFTIMNYEALHDDPLMNAGYFVYMMIVDMYYQQHDNRVVNDLIAIRYPRLYLNYDYMNYERKIILKAINSKDNHIKLNFYRMFLNIRDLRRQMIGNEYSMLEYNFETIEGLATYAMYKAICYVDKAKGKAFLKDVIKNFSTANKNILDFRTTNKNTGFLMALIMVDLQIDIMPLFENYNTLYQLSTSKIKFIREPIAYRSDKSLIEEIGEFEEAVAEKFTLFFDNAPKRVNGSFQIFAYDPNRIFADKENIYHESFVILKNLFNNELVRVEGPVVTKVLDNSLDIVTSYHYIDKKNKKY